ncbi:MAG TPA: hypothetical protein VLF42_08900 [Burkholderiales bacterium]|nr:hypothetical protein [Burkholderiales bacterium]
MRPLRVSVSLFAVAMATLMFEILLTRVFSLTLWYHFAFMAISIAMFGMTVGALIVFLRPAAWPQAKLPSAMGRCALAFALTMAAAVFLHVYLFLPNPRAAPIVWTFLCTAIPFVFSGIFISLALTRFPGRVAMLYAFDLAGAAAGCLLVIAALQWLDGLGAVLACASFAALAATLLASGWVRAAAAGASVALAGTTLAAGLHLARNDVSLFPIVHVKGMEQTGFEYERWNSFSRITVSAPNGGHATAWSLSAAYGGPLEVAFRWLQIDAVAGTQLIGFDGDLKRVEFLRWDLTNFVHHLRRGARVCIVGAGGGRDVLTTKVFGQKSALAVEINGDIMKVVNGRFGSFTGHLDSDPAVRLVNDEARSYLTRAREPCDIVQVTFIDTWAATAAGAYVLSENTLYTVEGWKVFLDRLGDDGLLAVARGVGPQLARMVGLGREALRASGARHPEQHMVVVANRLAKPPRSFGPMAMLLVRKTPFTDDDLARLREAAARMRFAVELEPRGAGTPFLRAMASGRGIAEHAPADGLNYEPPDDDRPFFFNMQRFRLSTLLEEGMHPVALLLSLLLGVTALTLACIGVPLALSRIALRRGDAALLGFFAAIGTGFMLVEIAMLQRLTVFLGHPAYSLSVILFVILLAGGAGSGLSARIPHERLARHGIALLLALCLVLGAVALCTVPLLGAFAASATPVRIAVAAALLAAMGLLMGTAFPIGMRLALASREALAPWLWGVNGATSVLASVLAVAISMAFGISMSFWAGVAAYVLALGAFAAAARRPAWEL